MGEKINTDPEEFFPSVSPDHKYLFFSSTKNVRVEVYWINAKIIEDLKPDELKKGE